MLSLNAWGRGLILPQLNVPEFVDSPWEPLTIEGNGWGWAGGEERCMIYWTPKENLRIAILSGFISRVCDSVSNSVCCSFLH